MVDTLPSWMIAAASRIAFDGEVSSMPEAMLTGRRKVSPSQPNHSNTFSDVHLGFGERAFSAAGAAFLSVILVNPLDVAKTRLQAQAATDPYSHSGHHVNGCMASLGPERMYSDLKCSPSCTRAGYFGAEMACTPECSRYKGTMDVFYKIIRQEGVGRLWRGTNANLALAIPTAFKETQTGVKPPGVRKTLLGVLSPVRNTNKNLKNLQNYRILWTGVGTQLARDVPYSAICWSTLEPIRRKILVMVGEEANAASILGANFSAGFIAGSLAAAATCPLDVVKTRRQIEKDPRKAMGMTTRQTLMEVWRDGGIKGLFMGVGPRVGRAGPSVGIVVSFYEVVKYVLYQRSETS